MRAWTVAEWGLENLTLLEHDRPKPGPGEVLVRFRSASLNYRDLLVVQGHYNPRFPRPMVPGSDGYGQIVELGPDTDEKLAKRHILSVFAPHWLSGPPDESSLRQTMGGPLPGVFQEYRVFRPEELHFLEEPSALTAAEWATLPCAGVTAWTGLFQHGGLQPGQTVVLLGTGGVSIFALQLARSVGARVLLLSSSQEKRERALEMGADAVACYRENPKWGQWVLAQTGGRGADLVLETGGSGTLAQSLKAVKLGGTVSLIGVLSGTEEKLNILPLLMKAVQVKGIVVGHKQNLEELEKACLQTGIRPVVDTIMPFEQLPEAFQALASGQHFGKIALDFPWEE